MRALVDTVLVDHLRLFYDRVRGRRELQNKILATIKEVLSEPVHYIYRKESRTVHLAEVGDLTLCGANRGLNRLGLKKWLKSKSWKAVRGKNRKLCKNCKHIHDRS